MKKTVTTEIALQSAIGELRGEFKASGYLRIQTSDKAPRSLSQNAISHAWFAQVARELREDTEHGVKCYCKLHFGIPILRADSEEFRELYDTVIKPLPYEKKLKAMALLPVSSSMDKGQLSRYLECIQEAYRGRVALEFPNEAPPADPQAYRSR